MHFELAQDYAVSLFLHMVRVGAFMAVVPLFGRQLDTLIVRLVLTVALGGVFWWVGDQRIALPGDLLATAGVATREVLVGVALGFALSTMTAMLAGAGDLISSEMGFSMARVLNPENGSDAAVIAQLLQALGFLLILHFDLHHDALRVLEHTFRACPVGGTLDLEPIWHGLQALVAGCVLSAVQYSFPILGIMLLLSVGLVLLGRAVPTINLMEFGYALRVLVALGALAWFVVEGGPFLIQTFRGVLEGATAMFPG
jgi:flagellar biosynthesis protein FliR